MPICVRELKKMVFLSVFSEENG